MGASLLSPTHLIVIAVVGLLLFGAKRLPEVGRSLGTGLREFKTTVSGLDGIAGPVEGVEASTAVVDPELAE
jgi:sec-independent protein translocase protein TatA